MQAIAADATSAASRYTAVMGTAPKTAVKIDMFKLMQVSDAFESVHRWVEQSVASGIAHEEYLGFAWYATVRLGTEGDAQFAVDHMVTKGAPRSCFKLIP